MNRIRLGLTLIAAALLAACTTAGPAPSPAPRTAVTGINIVEDPAGYPLRGHVRDLFLGRLQDRLFREGAFHRAGNLTLRWKAREWNETTEEPFIVGVTYLRRGWARARGALVRRWPVAQT